MEEKAQAEAETEAEEVEEEEGEETEADSLDKQAVDLAPGVGGITPAAAARQPTTMGGIPNLYDFLLQTPSLESLSCS